MNRDHRQVDKWIAGAVALAAVYSLYRLSYSTALFNGMMLGIFVIAVSGSFSLVVTWFFGCPGKTLIEPVRAISFSPFRIVTLRNPEQSIKAIRIYCYAMLIILIYADFHIITDYILYQRHANDVPFMLFVVKLTMPLAVGWAGARPVVLRDEWLWVRIIACLVIPAAFLLDAWAYGRLLMESEDLAVLLPNFVLLAVHFYIAMSVLFYGAGRKHRR